MPSSTRTTDRLTSVTNSMESSNSVKVDTEVPNKGFPDDNITADPVEVTVYSAEVTGWRLNVTLASCALALLLSSIETTIVATSLVRISSDFNHWNLSSWIVVAYLLAYASFLAIFARLSDFFGRRNCLIAALSCFVLFSGLCGAAQTMYQLIVFRALQGIGGSGIYSMVMVIVPESVPVSKLGMASGMVGGVFASACVLGPVLGGVIIEKTTWRWIFLINCPTGVLAAVLVLWVFPRRPGLPNYIRSAFRRTDWFGVFLLIAATTLLVYGLQEGGTAYAWNSAPILTTLILSVFCWIAFGVWEFIIPRLPGHMIPIFPLHLATNRVLVAAMLNSFFIGFLYMVTIIGLPQRFQLVFNKSPIRAGLDSIPLLLLAAVGSACAGALCSKKNHSFLGLTFANILQIVGTALLSTIPFGDNIPARAYGYQIIQGFGIGFNMPSLMVMTRVETLPRHQATIVGAVTQLRILGAVIGLAIATTTLTNYVTPRLRGIITSAELQELLQSNAIIGNFTAEQQRSVREVYNSGYNLQMKAILAPTIVCFFISMFAYRKVPLPLETSMGGGERVEMDDLGEKY